MAPSLQHKEPTGLWLRGSPLGSGSFGKVCLGLSLNDGLLFAVKSTPLSPSSQINSLRNEFHILETLDSPHIVRCLGANICELDNTPCFSLFLEYMQQGSIADLVKKSGGKLDEAHARVCTRAILEGLCYLHKQGIIHSDIKGQNILLGSGGEIKIADFGTARRVSCTENLENCSMRGTPLWMAPEVVQGVEQGTASDIWSLGCTLVEMLQGRPPWGSTQEHTSPNHLASLLFKIAYTNDSPPLVDCLLSTEATDFLSKCLQRDPKERWTAEQLLQHPFAMVNEKGLWGYGTQASPRGTLEIFVDSDMESESLSSLDSCMSCVYTTELYCGGRQQKRVSDLEGAVVKDCDTTWLTVRHAEGWSEDRQKPFLKAGEELVIRKGSQVSFESVGFLGKRVGVKAM